MHTSTALWSSIDKDNISKINQFYLNTIAYEHRQKVPFPKFTFDDHSDLRYSDSVLVFQYRCVFIIYITYFSMFF
jgi:hypothetical protein